MFTLETLIALTVLLSAIALCYFLVIRKPRPTGIPTVTVRITREELGDGTDLEKFRRYVVRYLSDNPIPAEHREIREQTLLFIGQQIEGLRFSYVTQFAEPLVFWFNPDTFYREILNEVEKYEAVKAVNGLHTYPL